MILASLVIFFGARSIHQKQQLKAIEIQSQRVQKLRTEVNRERKLLMELRNAKKERTKSTIITLQKRDNEVREKVQALEEAYSLLQERIRGLKQPHLNNQNYRVYRDDYGYERLVADGQWFHRFWAYRQVYQKHKEWFFKKGRIYFSLLEVHHIDGDKLNNDESNLAILTKEEHKKIEHTKNIPVHDYVAGIRELRRLGIQQPHLKNTLDK
jgi:hypothetical protein